MSEHLRAAWRRVAEKPRLDGLSVVEESDGGEFRTVVALLYDYLRIGYLRWIRSDAEGDRAGMVSDVVVEPLHWRQGVATALWETAKALDPGLRHSDAQSPSGAEWAKTVAKQAASGTLYHGTAYPFRTGDIVVPASKVPGGGNYQSGVGSSPNHVYLSNDLAQAFFFAVLAAGARGLGRPWVFEVEARGTSGSQAYPGQEVLAEEATILRDVTDQARAAFEPEKHEWAEVIQETVPFGMADRFLPLLGLAPEPPRSAGGWNHSVEYDEWGDPREEWSLDGTLDTSRGLQVIIEKMADDDFYWSVYVDGTEADFGTEETLAQAQRAAEQAWAEHGRAA